MEHWLSSGSQGTLFCCLCRWHEPFVLLKAFFPLFLCHMSHKNTPCCVYQHDPPSHLRSCFWLQQDLENSCSQYISCSCAPVCLLVSTFVLDVVVTELLNCSNGIRAPGSICQALGSFSAGPALWLCFSQRCSWHSVISGQLSTVHHTQGNCLARLLLTSGLSMASCPQTSLKNSFKCSLYKMEQPDTWDRYFLKH